MASAARDVNIARCYVGLFTPMPPLWVTSITRWGDVMAYWAQEALLKAYVGLALCLPASHPRPLGWRYTTSALRRRLIGGPAAPPHADEYLLIAITYDQRNHRFRLVRPLKEEHP